jgi:small subunit ribosomal protein S20
MANHASSKKRIRRNERRAEINGPRRSRIRTQVKKVELALQAGDADQAQEALKAAQPEIMRGVSKGIFHKNTAARKMSRLTQRIKALKTSSK